MIPATIRKGISTIVQIQIRTALGAVANSPRWLQKIPYTFDLNKNTWNMPPPPLTN